MKHIAFLLVTALLLAGCAQRSDGPGPNPTTPAPTLPEPLQQVEWTGTGCAELALSVPSDISNVRPFVPAQYTLLEVGGRALVMVGTSRCDSASVFGNATNNLVMSDVGVFIESPTGEAGSTFYYLWHASNRDMISSSMARVGQQAYAAPNSNFLTFGLVQTTIIESRIAAESMPYRSQGTAVPAPVATNLEATWFHTRENVTVRTDFTLALRTEGPASGNISATPGSDLSKLLGGAEARGDGVYWTFDLEVHSRRTTD
jgi:hypothetical protein